MAELTSVAGLLNQERSKVPAASKRPERLATPVIADFVDQIVGGNFPPGTDLPSETNIRQYLGISRTVLREALKVLEQKGLVRVENGRGTRINERDEWNLLDPIVLSSRLKYDIDGSFMSHLMKVRATLEADMAEEAALATTQDEMKQMSEQLDELRRSVHDHDRYVQFDSQFHDTFMRASQNELGRAIVMNMYVEARAELNEDVEDHVRETSLHGHEAVYEAIFSRDPKEAARAVRAHINEAWAERSNRKTTSPLNLEVREITSQ